MGEAARRTETEPAWYTPHATAACGLDVARDRNPQRHQGLLEPCAGKPARAVLRGPRHSNAPGLPDNHRDVRGSEKPEGFLANNAGVPIGLPAPPKFAHWATAGGVASGGEAA